MRNDCLDMTSDVLRDSVRSATNALSEFATQCLLLHQPVGVIGPQGIYWRTPPPELHKHIASPQKGQSALRRRRRNQQFSRIVAMRGSPDTVPKKTIDLADIPSLWWVRGRLRRRVKSSHRSMRRARDPRQWPARIRDALWRRDQSPTRQQAPDARSNSKPPPQTSFTISSVNNGYPHRMIGGAWSRNGGHFLGSGERVRRRSVGPLKLDLVRTRSRQMNMRAGAAKSLLAIIPGYDRVDRMIQRRSQATKRFAFGEARRLPEDPMPHPICR
jgi:hypothetical protein